MSNSFKRKIKLSQGLLKSSLGETLVCGFAQFVPKKNMGRCLLTNRFFSCSSEMNNKSYHPQPTQFITKLSPFFSWNLQPITQWKFSIFHTKNVSVKLAIAINIHKFYYTIWDKCFSHSLRSDDLKLINLYVSYEKYILFYNVRIYAWYLLRGK